MRSYTMRIFSLIFLFSLSCSYGFSQERNIESSVLAKNIFAQLKLKQGDVNEELYVEKVLPNMKSQTVMVIPKYRKNEPDGYGNYYLELDAYIIIADNTNGKILYKYYEENAWTSDASRLSSITINTGLFNLNSETRAFGINVSYQGSSQPNPNHHTDLSLFVKSNQSLKKVLSNYTTETFGGEWDMKCVGEFEQVSSTIIVDKKRKTKNFNDLIIKDKITKTINTPVNDDCIEKETVSSKTLRLKFNGTEYK
ncbi:PA3715 family protein [Pedobacter agri]|uniref:DUF4412 domain-containing protein n=1 Tax=Pedobacter agri TaxID=454586 RepID=A0A9X3DBB2_9SPHI|nr:hypothetical protein [Pedobacter agri]MCX3264437.1 hypothetical protein [Pedobacter agri]